MMLPFPLTPIQISWLTFGIVNVPAALITFGVLRPITRGSLRGASLGSIAAAAFAGAIGGALLFAALSVLLGSRIGLNLSAGRGSWSFGRCQYTTGKFLFL